MPVLQAESVEKAFRRGQRDRDQRRRLLIAALAWLLALSLAVIVMLRRSPSGR